MGGAVETINISADFDRGIEVVLEILPLPNRVPAVVRPPPLERGAANGAHQDVRAVGDRVRRIQPLPGQRPNLAPICGGDAREGFAQKQREHVLAAEFRRHWHRGRVAGSGSAMLPDRAPVPPIQR